MPLFRVFFSFLAIKWGMFISLGACNTFFVTQVERTYNIPKSNPDPNPNRGGGLMLIGVRNPNPKLVFFGRRQRAALAGRKRPV